MKKKQKKLDNLEIAKLKWDKNLPLLNEEIILLLEKEYINIFDIDENDKISKTDEMYLTWLMTIQSNYIWKYLPDNLETIDFYKKLVNQFIKTIIKKSLTLTEEEKSKFESVLKIK